ncbi:hypothetical protein DOTSEDRAFT_53167 [Dothistroma septosporum NZE10]|uniref:Uncharacterized protein n=1 Tax=Dothistroma septosporum (strain NZE10 / CBS 128990) TaxID=675120 RepID=N1PLJ7_DOTSN|nr:hypothetical protein DOTSEDRAFT_53167 [Dothistroma septosporum NZE10]
MVCRGYLPKGVSCSGIFYDFKRDWFTDQDRNCADLFDGDVAGIGVIIAFILSVVITTAASICAAVIDFRVGEKSGLIPLSSRLLLADGDRRALRFRMWRKVLDRLILGFADQQIVTGFALLIIAYIKITPRQYRLPSAGMQWLEMATGNFALVVFLCVASSSSHLACLMVLNDYFTKHKSMAYFRVALVACFSILLTVTIAITSSFTGYLYMLAYYAVSWIPGESTEAQARLVVVVVLGVPLATMFYLFWICTLQLLPDVRGWLKEWLSVRVYIPLYRLSRLDQAWRWATKELSPLRRRRLAQALKSTAWTLILGNRSLVYAIQIVMAVLSVTWILLQRFAGVPKGYERSMELCSMSEAAQSHEVWSFGQMLPLFLLSLPLLAAWELYVEERENLRLEVLLQDESRPVSSSTSGVDLRSLHRQHSAVVSVSGDNQSALADPPSLVQSALVNVDDTNTPLGQDHPDNHI